MRNAYDSQDPEHLLRLKRLEADALRDVIKAIKQAHHKPSDVFKITANTLLAQLGVGKMIFLYRTGEGIQTGISRGFPAMEMPAYGELPVHTGTIRVHADTHPHLAAMGAENIITFPFIDDAPAAWFIIARFADTEAERENDLIFIETLGNALCAVLENQILVREMIRQETVRRELEVAQHIQQQLLPSELHSITDCDVVAFSEPHHHIGGDFYDVIQRGDQGYFICIADVSGKGIGAALLMANLQAQIRALLLSENHLVDVIKKLNRTLLTLTRGEQFVTLFIAHARLQDHEMDYINAGHNYPFFINGEGVQELKEGTIPLGMLELPGVKQTTLPIHPGDRMLLYTDGLVDQHNPSGQLLGEQRVRAAVSGWKQETSAELVATLIEIRKDFAQGTPAGDDVTLLAIRFRHG